MQNKNSATRPTSRAPTRQAARAQAHLPTGTYRFSDRFIKTTTPVLITVMLVSIAAGFIIGPLSDNVAGESGDVLGLVAAALIIGGLALPLLLAAVLGGEAIRAGAGIIGFFPIVGMFAAAAGNSELGQEMLGPVWTPWAFWAASRLWSSPAGASGSLAGSRGCRCGYRLRSSARRAWSCADRAKTPSTWCFQTSWTNSAGKARAATPSGTQRSPRC
ncbi:hypothetical protein ABIB51_003551 [Arthrobacter sp. UYCu712]